MKHNNNNNNNDDDDENGDHKKRDTNKSHRRKIMHNTIACHPLICAQPTPAWAAINLF